MKKKVNFSDQTLFKVKNEYFEYNWGYPAARTVMPLYYLNVLCFGKIDVWIILENGQDTLEYITLSFCFSF